MSSLPSLDCALPRAGNWSLRLLPREELPFSRRSLKILLTEGLPPPSTWQKRHRPPEGGDCRPSVRFASATECLARHGGKRARSPWLHLGMEKCAKSVGRTRGMEQPDACVWPHGCCPQPEGGGAGVVCVLVAQRTPSHRASSSPPPYSKQPPSQVLRGKLLA